MLNARYQYPNAVPLATFSQTTMQWLKPFIFGKTTSKNIFYASLGIVFLDKSKSV